MGRYSNNKPETPENDANEEYKIKKKHKLLPIEEYPPRGTDPLPPITMFKDFCNVRDFDHFSSKFSNFIQCWVEVHNPHPSAGKNLKGIYIPKYIYFSPFVGIQYHVDWENQQFITKFIHIHKKLWDFNIIEREKFGLKTDADKKRITNELKTGGSNIDWFPNYQIKSIKWRLY